MIYRKSRFGHRKSFGHFGSVPGVPGGFRGAIGRGHSRREATWALGVAHQPLVGWASQPLRAHAARVRGKEKTPSGEGKLQVGKESYLE